MEPKFTYKNDPDKIGNLTDVVINENNKDDESRHTKKRKVNVKTTGSSLGWGWFQGFNLFVTGCFLLLCFIFAYFMFSGSQTRVGPPKYVLDETNDQGIVIFNPQIPAKERESFVYVPPVKNEARDSTENTEIDTPNLGEITLLSSSESTDNTSDDLPEINLTSVDEDNDLPLLSLESTQNIETVDPEILRLDELANVAFGEGRISDPYDNSALNYYQSILKIDPNSQIGHDGIQKITTYYIEAVQNEMQNNRYLNAIELIEKGLKIDPKNPTLNGLKTQLN